MESSVTLPQQDQNKGMLWQDGDSHHLKPDLRLSTEWTALLFLSKQCQHIPSQARTILYSIPPTHTHTKMQKIKNRKGWQVWNLWISSNFLDLKKIHILKLQILREYCTCVIHTHTLDYVHTDMNWAENKPVRKYCHLIHNKHDTTTNSISKKCVQHKGNLLEMKIKKKNCY